MPVCVIHTVASNTAHRARTAMDFSGKDEPGVAGSWAVELTAVLMGP